uniref:Uncharacterized protein n=1 Tax=Oryza punctata TaxID=4537 RepID=A0A0E0MAE6_ORYPU
MDLFHPNATGWEFDTVTIEVKLGGIESAEAAERVGEKPPAARGDGGDSGRAERGVPGVRGGGGGGGGGARAVGGREDGGHGRGARGVQAAVGALPRRLRPRRGARRVDPPANRLRVPRRRGHRRILLLLLVRGAGRPRHQAHQRRPPRADEQGRPLARHRAPARRRRSLLRWSRWRGRRRGCGFRRCGAARPWRGRHALPRGWRPVVGFNSELARSHKAR